MEKFEIQINKKKVRAKKGETILEAALRSNIDLPNLCYYSDLAPSASCRLCVVEIKGKEGFITACNTNVEPGMEVTTDSPELERSRKINLELIFAQHIQECQDCVWYQDCKLLDLAKRYGLKKDRFEDRKKDAPVYSFGCSLIFDSSKCINCRNCINVCEKQKANYLKLKSQGHMFEVVPDEERDCIFCGQCIVHCPAGAFEAVGEFEDIEKPLLEKGKHVLFQIAPAVRTSLGEGFGLEYGENVLEKVSAGLKKLGAEKVFDVSVGADFTTVEEAEELKRRLKKKRQLPMLTSCCPAWVEFIRKYYPRFIPYLTTVKSPHIISGTLLKTYYAQREKIDPKKVTVVSVMPCVSKKHEIELGELKVEGLKPVDYVLTARELIRLFKRKKIDISKIRPRKLDNPFGEASGAGIIFGKSGGVAEAALRTAFGRKLKVDFQQSKKMKGVKEAEVNDVRVAVVHGMESAEKVLKNPSLYDFVEVMACPGGCVGGGGQPLPANKGIIEKRTKGILDIDKKKKTRMAHKNPIIKRVYKEFLNSEEKRHSFCHVLYPKGKPKK